jgi:hypothetical protein
MTRENGHELVGHSMRSTTDRFPVDYAAIVDDDETFHRDIYGLQHGVQVIGSIENWNTKNGDHGQFL